MLRSAIALVIFAAMTTPAAAASRKKPVPTRAAPKKPAPAAARIPIAKPVNPGGWITFDDYPLIARQASQEGRVAFRLAVAPSGAVTNCTITSSSGVPALDTQTCNLMRSRATFVPARMASTYSSSVNWLLYGRESSADGTKGRAAWEKGEYDKAMKQWKTEANKGNVAAQINLAYAYNSGVGVRADQKQAEYWYQKAAAQGNAGAQTAYGFILLQRGATADAQRWLERAAMAGDKDAQVFLATELYKGTRFPMDRARAYGLMKAASEGGDRVAAGWLRDNERDLTAFQRQQGLAIARQISAGATARPQPRTAQR